jgi:hypothetical protein
MSKGKTQREMFTRLSEVVASAGTPDGAELTDFIAGRIAALDKKSSAKRVATPEQVENAAIKAGIASLLSESEGMKSSAIAEAVGVSVQKSTALLAQMVKDGSAVRNQDGKAVTFTVA